MLQKNSKSNYSTLNDNNGNVKNIFVKEIKDFKDYGLAGFFWIRNGSKFVEYLKIFHQQFPKIKREIIIDDVINFCLSKGLSLGLVKLEKYCHLGTPDELNEYKYWQDNLSKLLCCN